MLDNPADNTISSPMDQRSVITETTCALEELTPTILELLDRRSAAFTNGAHFDMALRDAFKLQVLDPSSSRGYIRSGEIYASQGRQLAAIAVYEDGMKNVPRSDPHYSLLEQGKANAEQRNNQRVDFMRILPMDIILAIGCLLITGDNPILYHNGVVELLPCLQVSKSWRQSLLLCGHLHLKERTGSREFTFKGPDISSILPYTQSLTMKSTNRRLYGLLFTTEGEVFESLQKLSISCTSDDSGSPFSNESNVSRLMNILQSISNTLTHLKIRMTTNHYQPVIQHLPITLEDLLNTCPNLIALDVVGIMVDLNDASIEYPVLERLKLESPTSPVSKENIICLLSKLPSLQSFIIDGCRDPSAVIIMLDHRPSLRHIGFGKCLVHLEGAVDKDNNDAFATHLVHIPSGKLMLELGDIGSDDDSSSNDNTDGDVATGYTFQDLTAIFQRYKDILHALTISAECLECPDPSIELHHLQQLAICSTNDYTGLFEIMDPFMTHWFIHHACNLTKMAVLDDYLSSETLVDIECMTQIQELEFAVRFNYQEQLSLPRLWNHFKRLGAASPLRKLKLHISNVNDGGRHKALYGISGMATLEELQFHVGDVIVEEAFVPIIKKLAQGCPSLTHLTLASSSVLGVGITYGVLFELRYMKHLKDLTLIAREVPKPAISSLLGCTGLEHIRLRCNGIQSMIPILRAKFPHVEYHSYSDGF